MYRRGAQRIKFQIRSCDDSSCSGESFVGPDGLTTSFYSETTTSTITLPSKTITSMSRNQYFQYRAILETSSSTLNAELKSVTLANTGAGVAGVTVTQSGGTTAIVEGGATDSYTIVLDAQTIEDTSVSVSPNSECTVSTSTIVFSSSTWSNAVTVTVTPTNDSVAEGAHVCTITHTAASSDSDYNGITISSVSATVTDNDTAGVTITESGGSTTITEAGATDTYTVVLDSAPTSTVTVALSLSDATQASLSTSSIAFTSSNWSEAVTVTLTPTNDSVAEGSHTVTVSHTVTSANWNYNGITVNSVVASITDNDSAGVTVTESGGSLVLTEAGVTDTYTVVLTSAPTSTVTIIVTPDSQTTVSTSSIAFTSSNWSDAVTVTVTPVDDSIAEGTHVSTITHTSESANSNYNGITVTSATADITDNDTAGVTVTQSGGATSVSEAGSTDTYTLVLDSAPTSTVLITITGSADISLSTSSVQFSSANWDTAVTITVTAVNDSTVEGSETTTLIHTVTSDNWNYNGIVVDSVSASITDNDVASSGGDNNNSGASPPQPPAPVFQNESSSDPSPVALVVPLRVSVDAPINFSAAGQNHSIRQVGVATDAQITVLIQSDPITVTLKKQKPQDVDLDNDKKIDIQLLYLGKKNGIPEIETKIFGQSDPKRLPFSINQGASTTSIQSVILYFQVKNVAWMAISENKNFASASFVPFKNEYAWKLSNGFGTKTVYARLRSSAGGTIDLSDSIVYESKISAPPSVPKLSSIENKSSVIFSRFLKKGMTGEDVRALQSILQTLGFMEKAVTTNFYGMLTEQAVKKFQKSQGIDSVGYVGPATRKALNAIK